VRAGYLEWQSQRRQAVLRHLETLDARFQTEQIKRDKSVQEQLALLQQLRGVMCCPNCNHPCGETTPQMLQCGKFICGRLETDCAASFVAGGCGREFKVEEARPFKADLPAALMEPLRKDIAKWIMADGQPLRCGCCENGIEGPLLQCVGCNGLKVCIRCEAKGHEHVRKMSQHPCHDASHYFIISMNPDPRDSQKVASLAAGGAAAGAATAAVAVENDAGVQRAHVFREGGSKTSLRSRATTSRDESVMVVPKVLAGA
jgi:hypothetical protein